MRTNYGIPQEQLDEIVIRDKECIYCHKKFSTDINNRRDQRTIEHLNHRKNWDSVGDFIRKGKKVYSIIAICCGSCNASRSDLAITDWFKTEYCKTRGISKKTVGNVVSEYINKYET